LCENCVPLVNLLSMLATAVAIRIKSFVNDSNFELLGVNCSSTSADNKTHSPSQSRSRK
jgi:hypothetical protein